MVHDKCIRYTSVVDVGEDKLSRIDNEFRNVFNAIDLAQACASCGLSGATIRCSSQTCGMCYHFLCAENQGWNFDKQGQKFQCSKHVQAVRSIATLENPDDVVNKTQPEVSVSIDATDVNIDTPRSLDADPSDLLTLSAAVVVDSSDEDSGDSHGMEDNDGSEAPLPFDIPLAFNTSLSSKFDGSRRGVVRLVFISRETVHDQWNVDLFATCTEGSAERVLSVAGFVADLFDQLEEGDIVRAINGIRVGSPDLDTLPKVLKFLNQEVEAMLEVRRIRTLATQWS